MVFGRKKKEEPKVEEQEAEDETPDLEVDVGDQEEEEEVEEIKPIKKPKIKPIKKVKAEAQIISGELIEGGIHRYIVVSNKVLGEIGFKFDLD